jgi:hypothetical protein
MNILSSNKFKFEFDCYKKQFEFPIGVLAEPAVKQFPIFAESIIAALYNTNPEAGKLPTGHNFIETIWEVVFKDKFKDSPKPLTYRPDVTQRISLWELSQLAVLADIVASNNAVIANKARFEEFAENMFKYVKEFYDVIEDFVLSAVDELTNSLRNFGEVNLSLRTPTEYMNYAIVCFNGMWYFVPSIRQFEELIIKRSSKIVIPGRNDMDSAAYMLGDTLYGYFYDLSSGQGVHTERPGIPMPPPNVMVRRVTNHGVFSIIMSETLSVVSTYLFYERMLQQVSSSLNKALSPDAKVHVDENNKKHYTFEVETAKMETPRFAGNSDQPE